MSGPTGQSAGYPPAGYPPPAYFNPQPPPSRVSPMAIVAIFIGVMLGLALVAAIALLFNQPAPPVPACPTGERCAPQPSLPPVSQASPTTPVPTAAPTPVPATLAPGATATPFVAPTATPVSNAPPLISDTQWQSATLGFSFEYDPGVFDLTESGDDFAVFSAIPFDAQVVIDVANASRSPAEAIAKGLAWVDGFMIGRVEDADSYDALLGPSIGYVRGAGAVYAGTMLSGDGTPVAPGGVTVLASTDGRLTVMVMVVVWQPDDRLGGETHQHEARAAADLFLKTFDWNTND